MNNIHSQTKKAVPGFWAKLALAAEAASESYAERLEKRISRLEGEVDRLLAIQEKLTKS